MLVGVYPAVAVEPNSFVVNNVEKIKMLSPGVVDQEQPDTSEIHFLGTGKHWQIFEFRGNKIEEVVVDKKA